jgi:hypothetical protein
MDTFEFIIKNYKYNYLLSDNSAIITDISDISDISDNITSSHLDIPSNIPIFEEKIIIINNLALFLLKSFNNITTLTLPDTLFFIRNYTFAGLENLETVDFGVNPIIEYIGDYAFYGCHKLITIKLPNSVIEIGECAFYECFALTSITIPSTIIIIGDNAFYDCGIEKDNFTMNIGKVHEQPDEKKDLEECPCQQLPSENKTQNKEIKIIPIAAPYINNVIHNVIHKPKYNIPGLSNVKKSFNNFNFTR